MDPGKFKEDENTAKDAVQGFVHKDKTGQGTGQGTGGRRGALRSTRRTDQP